MDISLESPGASGAFFNSAPRLLRQLLRQFGPLAFGHLAHLVRNNADVLDLQHVLITYGGALGRHHDLVADDAGLIDAALFRAVTHKSGFWKRGSVNVHFAPKATEVLRKRRGLKLGGPRLPACSTN
jgi:hypothetical protein